MDMKNCLELASTGASGTPSLLLIGAITLSVGAMIIFFLHRPKKQRRSIGTVGYIIAGVAIAGLVGTALPPAQAYAASSDCTVNGAASPAGPRTVPEQGPTPSVLPTESVPSDTPSHTPSATPTAEPSTTPTVEPTPEPTPVEPTPDPTPVEPTPEPTPVESTPEPAVPPVAESVTHYLNTLHWTAGDSGEPLGPDNILTVTERHTVIVDVSATATADSPATIDPATIDLDPSTPGIQHTLTNDYYTATVDPSTGVITVVDAFTIGSMITRGEADNYAVLSYTVQDSDGRVSNTATISLLPIITRPASET